MPSDNSIIPYQQGRRKKNFQRGQRKKKDRKLAINSTIQPLPGRQRATKKRPKNSKKKLKNSTFKPLSTIFVPCMKI